MNQPSPRRIEAAMGLLLRTRQHLLADDDTLPEDQKLWADLLEGESPGEPFAALEQLIEAAVAAGEFAAAARERCEDLRARAARFERRRDTLRELARAMLEALDLRRLERPAWTASVRDGQPKVEVSDPAALPDTFCRIVREPDKRLILAELKAGRPIAGAALGNGPPTLTIRTR